MNLDINNLIQKVPNIDICMLNLLLADFRVR